MKRKYQRFPFIVKIILLGSIIVAGKFGQRITPYYASQNNSVSTKIYSDSIVFKPKHQPSFFELVNLKSEE